MSDPVTTHSLALTEAFWHLDWRIARRRHFPSVNWASSYSRYTTTLENYYRKISYDFPDTRAIIKSILSEEAELGELVKIVGKDPLEESQKHILDIAQIIRNDFLQQNIFSMFDRYCTPEQDYWMMKNIITYHKLVKKLLKTQKQDWSDIKKQTEPVYKKLYNMKFCGEEDNAVLLLSRFNQEIIDFFSSNYN